MNRYEAETQIRDFLENSGLTFGETMHILNRLIAVYADKGKNFLQAVPMEIVAREKRR